jgi:hypothetical protein
VPDITAANITSSASRLYLSFYRTMDSCNCGHVYNLHQYHKSVVEKACYVQLHTPMWNGILSIPSCAKFKSYCLDISVSYKCKEQALRGDSVLMLCQVFQCSEVGWKCLSRATWILNGNGCISTCSKRECHRHTVIIICVNRRWGDLFWRGDNAVISALFNLRSKLGELCNNGNHTFCLLHSPVLNYNPIQGTMSQRVPIPKTISSSTTSKL